MGIPVVVILHGTVSLLPSVAAVAKVLKNYFAVYKMADHLPTSNPCLKEKVQRRWESVGSASTVAQE